MLSRNIRNDKTDIFADDITPKLTLYAVLGTTTAQLEKVPDFALPSALLNPISRAKMQTLPTSPYFGAAERIDICFECAFSNLFRATLDVQIDTLAPSTFKPRAARSHNQGVTSSPLLERLKAAIK